MVDGRVELLDEIDQANEAVRAFLIQRMGELLAAPSFMEALPGQLPGDTASQARLPIIRARLRAIATLGARPTSAQVDALLAPRTGSTIAVESSNIRSIAYEATTQVLTVAFHSGGTYDYADVPRLVYQGFMNAYSKGRYHHQWIRDRYSFSRRA